MELMVFPLPLCLVLCLLPPSTCLHDGRAARRLDSNIRGFFPPSSDLTHFPLSGFSPTNNNRVDTPFTVPGLNDLPPLHSRIPQPRPETKQRATPTKPKHPSILNQFQPPKPSASRPTNIGDIFSNLRPSGSFPTLFDPFKNFFTFPSIPPIRHQPAPKAAPTLSSVAPAVTKPCTTPRPVGRVATPSTPSTPSTPVRAVTEEDRILNRDSVHVYQSSDYGDFYPGYDVASDYQDYQDYHTDTDTDDNLYPQDDSPTSLSCPGSLRECLTACSPVISINQVAYKLCVNECLDRCQ